MDRGLFSTSYTYETYPGPVGVPRNVVVQGGREAVLTLDTAIRIKKHQQPMTGFDLIARGEDTPLLQVRRRRDNDYPLGETFPVPCGIYTLGVHLEDMEEPSPVGEGIEIQKGRLLEFDTGL